VIARLSVIATAILPRAAVAQRAPVKTDSVLLARDLNGNGKTDYVIRESRRGAVPEARETRLAIYLDSAPRVHKPHFANDWDIGDIDSSIVSTRHLSPGVSPFVVVVSGGYYAASPLLLVQKSGVSEALSFGVDYGNGYMDIGETPDGLVILATDDHLELRKKPVGPSAECGPSRWSVRKVVFDTRQLKFIAGKSFCTARKLF